MTHQQLKKELQDELRAILGYWMQYAPDTEQGGYYGRIDNDNNVYAYAPKGVVLHARILWTFSAAYNTTGEKKYLPFADRAYDYIVKYFLDYKYGGVYWSVEARGQPLDTKKQIYALAFLLYGCCEYYKSTRLLPAWQLAVHLYELIQQYSYDKTNGGYLEAFDRNWQAMNDVRLSGKDANTPKTTNTHLHVLEAYTSLYRIHRSREVAQHIELLLDNFDRYIINKKSRHLDMFFTEDWQVKPGIISYGHDIEAAWLLLEAAEATGNDELVAKFQQNALAMADAVLQEGIDTDGGLWYECDPQQQQMISEKHWWPQAEALVGFLNAWKISGEEKYLQVVFSNWEFIKQHIRDSKKGEWFWGVKSDYAIMEKEDKVGIWKCPYHNSRACMEVIRRLESAQVAL